MTLKNNFTKSWTIKLMLLSIIMAMGSISLKAASLDMKVLPLGIQNTLAVDSVVIGTATTTANTPAYFYYGYSFTQTLYLASELNINNKTIDHIGFSYAGTNPDIGLEFEIWIKRTSSTEISATQQLVDFTKVYDGPVTFHAGELFSKITTTPFFCSNTDNLIITVIEKKPGYETPDDIFYATSV